MALLIVAPIEGYSAAGGRSHRLLWSNDKGFVPAANCRASTADAIPLRVSEAVGRARQLNRARSSTTTLDQFIHSDLADFVIEVKDVNRLAAQTSQPHGLDLHGSFWQATMENERYVTLTCGAEKKNYILFDIFVPSREERAAQIGVSQDEMGFLLESEIRTPGEAEAAINAITKTPASFARKGHAQAARSRSENAADRRPSEPPSAQTLVIPRGALPPSSSADAAHEPHSPTGAAKSSDGAPGMTAARPADADEAAQENQDASADAENPGSDFDPVVCSSASNIPVYDMALEKFLFYANPLEDVRVMQTFEGSEAVARNIDGQVHNLVRAQFPGRPDGQNAGWIQEGAIKQKSACALGAAKVRRPAPAEPKPLAKPATGGFTFPMAGRPKRSYREAPRRFRSGRAGGRLHAACDLYRPVGERVNLVTNGKVIRGPYLFYQGVYAIEVQHSNGWVVRYGEVLGRRAPGVSAGAKLAKGQTIGYVGWISSRRAQPMLHFELFSGRATGSLTQRWRHGFQRRSDLMDPTPYLTKWETEKFGTHW